MSASAEAPPPSSASTEESGESPPSPPASTSTSPPPESLTPPPSPPAPPTAANPPPPPPSSQPPPPSPPTSPPPAPPTSTPPPPVPSTPPATPPPPTPAASESPPPPAAAQSSPSPATVTPSTPPPDAVKEESPAQNPPPQAAVDPLPLPALSPPLPKPIPGEAPPSPPTLSPNPPRSPSPARPSSGSSQPTPASSSNDSQNLNGGVVAGIIVGVAVIIVLLIVIIICLICTRKKRKRDYYGDHNGGKQYYNNDGNPKLQPAGSFMGAPGWGPPSGELSTGGYSGQHPIMASQNVGGMSQFSYEELAMATNGFSQVNLLGQGGFGLVHKGVLGDGREVAVKSLKSGSGQGEREFQAEVEIISRVHHRHLVSLVGYCIANDKKLLVYEFVPNKTLEFHLYGKDQPVIDWPTRLRIAVGSAKGLAYLHEDCLPRIIHRDIKAANILIDNNYEAMVADFGLAKLTTDNNTHVSTRVMGTFGYLAPEYASSGKLSEKSDVFSFGVMLLELITGRRPIDLSNMMEDSLVDWARPLLSKALEDGNYDELVDPRLEGRYIHNELSRMAACAAASIRHSARKRPKMSQIVRALEGDSSLDDLNEGVKPGQSGMYNPNGGSEIYDTRAYNADMMKFKKMVMANSDDFNSSEYGNTSDYGLNPSVSSTDVDSAEIMHAQHNH